MALDTFLAALTEETLNTVFVVKSTIIQMVVYNTINSEELEEQEIIVCHELDRLSSDVEFSAYLVQRVQHLKNFVTQAFALAFEEINENSLLQLCLHLEILSDAIVEISEITDINQCKLFPFFLYCSVLLLFR